MIFANITYGNIEEHAKVQHCVSPYLSRIGTGSKLTEFHVIRNLDVKDNS